MTALEMLMLNYHYFIKESKRLLHYVYVDLGCDDFEMNT